MGEVECDVKVVQWLLDEAVEPLVKGVGDGEPDEQIDGGVDEALAKLGEVLHQAHAWEFGAVGDGGAYAVDEISHGEWPRWRLLRQTVRGRLCGGWRRGQAREPSC